MLTSAEEFAAGVHELREHYISLLHGVHDATWLRPTRLPGWSVQDVLSHVTAGVAMMLGEPLPDHTPPDAPHIRNDAGKFMEIAVDYRRSQSGAAVRDEFTSKSELLAEKLQGGLDLQEEIDGPMGSRPPRGPMLSIALLDWWIHEQDLRDTLGVPGGVAGIVAGHARDRIFTGLQHHLTAGVPAIAEHGIALEIDGARQLIGAVTGDGTPALTLLMSLLTSTALVAGRGDPEQARKDVVVDGDRDAADAVLTAMNFVP